MKELYNGSIERKEDGTFYVLDKKVDGEEMSEVELVLYLGSLLGSCVESMRQRKRVGTLHLKLMYWDLDILKK